MFQPTNQLLNSPLTAQASILNARSLLTEPISINLAWSNFTFLPPLYYTYSIHFQIYPPKDFCLCKSKNSTGFLRMLFPHGSKFAPYFQELLALESSCKSRYKRGWWRWILRKVSIVLHGNYLKGGHCHLLRLCLHSFSVMFDSLPPHGL